MKTFKVGDIVTIKKEKTPNMPAYILPSMLKEFGGRKFRITTVGFETLYLNDSKGYNWHPTAFEEYDDSTLNIKVPSKYNKITFNFKL